MNAMNHRISVKRTSKFVLPVCLLLGLRERTWKFVLLLVALTTTLHAQSALENSLIFTGTTTTSGADTYAWLVWQPSDPLFTAGHTVAIYRKAGGAASAVPYSRVSIVQSSADTRLINSLLPVAEALGDDLVALDSELSEMSKDAPPAGTVTLADKISALLVGAHGNAENSMRVILLGRQHAAIALCGGFGFADKIPAIGLRTYELRDYDLTNQQDISVLGRVTVDPSNVLTLPAPGAPVEVPDASPKGDLNMSMHWSTPNALRDLSPLQYGYNVYRLDKDTTTTNNWHNVAPPSLTALLNAGATKVNRLAVLPPTLLTEAESTNPATTTVFLNDDNYRYWGGFGFNDGDHFGYFVCARDLLGRGGLPSVGTLMQIFDRMPTNPPQQVHVRNDVIYNGTTRDQRLLVTWQPPQLTSFTESIASYYVYRWRTPEDIARLGREIDPVTHRPDHNLIAILPAFQTSFRDDGSTAPPAWANVDEAPPSTADDLGKTWYYTIRAVDGSLNGNLSGHSAPAWGVLRDREGPASVVGDVRMMWRAPSVSFTSYTQVPLAGMTDDQGHLLFVCTSTDPGLDWAEFEMPTLNNANEKMGRAYFAKVNGVWTAALRRTLPFNTGDRQVKCRVATKDGRVSGQVTSGPQSTPGPQNGMYLSINFAATVTNQPSDVRHDSVDPVTGETNDISGSFEPVATAREYKVYRRVNHSKQTLVASGQIVGTADVNWVDPNPPTTNATVCYFLQLFDEHGNGGELVPQGTCIESGSFVNMPVPIVEPITASTPLSPRMNVSWFCSTPGVERFEVWVARDSGAVPENTGSGLSNDVALVHPNDLSLKDGAKGLDFQVFDTGLARHLSPTGDPHFSVSLPVSSSDTYTVLIRAVGKGQFGSRITGKFSNIETFTYSLRRFGLSVPVPWPDRPLPPKADFHPGITAKYIGSNLVSPWQGNGVRIGEYKDASDTLISSPDTNNPARVKTYTVPSMRDIENYLYTNDEVGQAEPKEGITGLVLPVVMYRVQVANANYPTVPGDIVQVSPMMELIAQTKTLLPPSTTVTDPFIAILPASVTNLPRAISGTTQDIFLIDRQPVIHGARYKYFLVRFNPSKEIERVITTNEVSVP